MSQLRLLTGTTPSGASVRGIVEAAQQLGFTASAVRGDLDALRQCSLPLIAHLEGQEGPHFVVVQDFRARKVIVSDPARGTRRMTADGFRSTWSGVAILLEAGLPMANQRRPPSPLRRSLAFVGDADHLIAAAFLVSLVPLAAALASAYYLKEFASSILPRHDWNALTATSASLLIILLARSVSVQLRTVILVRLGQRLDRKLIHNVCSRIARLPTVFFDSRLQGDVLSRIGDANKVKDLLSGTPLMLLLDSVTAVLALLALAVQDGRLAGLLLLLLAIVFLVAALIGIKLRRIQASILEDTARLQSLMSETFSSITLVKALSAEDEVETWYSRLLGKLLPDIYRAMYLASMAAAVADCGLGIALLGTLWYVARAEMTGQATAGAVAAAYAVLVFVTQPVRRLVTLGQSVQDSLAASTRLHDFLDIPIELQLPVAEARPQESSSSPLLKVEDLTFGYCGRAPLMSRLSFSLFPGEILGIQGESGCGKTTLAKLLIRLYEAGGGTISFRGKDIRSYNLQHLRQQINYIQADAPAFAGTVWQNLMLGNGKVPIHDVFAILQRVGLSNWLASLPVGLNTAIGSRGVTLSLGQRQKLAIARALLRTPSIFVLDEITSSLDPESEAEIVQIIRALPSPDCAVIVIGHRIEMLAAADRLITLHSARHSAPRTDSQRTPRGLSPQTEGLHAGTA